MVTCLRVMLMDRIVRPDFWETFKKGLLRDSLILVIGIVPIFSKLSMLVAI